jgi:hypothetical protein
MISLAPSSFEVWAAREGYDTAPAVVRAADRIYADRQTQTVFDAWKAGAAHVARMVTESDWETEGLRNKLKALAVSE